MSDQPKVLTAEEKKEKRERLIGEIRAAKKRAADAEALYKAAEAAKTRADEEENEAFYQLCLYLAACLEDNPQWNKNVGGSGHFMLDGVTYFFQAKGWQSDGKGGSKRTLSLTRMNDPCFNLNSGAVYWQPDKIDQRAEEIPF